MGKDKPETFNCYVPQRYLDMVNEQLEIYPALKPSDVIGNILAIYYEGNAQWSKNKQKIKQEKEE